MRVSEIMTPAVVSIGPETPFKKIAQLLVDRDISSMPVVDEAGRLVGIVSESDLLRKEAYPSEPARRGLARLLVRMLAGEDAAVRRASALTARDLMTSPVITAKPEETVHALARRMVEERVKRVPVVADHHVVGMASRHDVMRIFVAGDRALRERIERVLRRSLYLPPEHNVSVTVKEGVARLEGTVQFESDIRVAEAIVGAVDGVIAVDNLLLYRRPDPTAADVRKLVGSSDGREP